MNKEEHIKEQIDSFKRRLKDTRIDFLNNLKPIIDDCFHKPITLNLLENIVEEINAFAKRNDLNMLMYVSIIDNDLVIFGSNLESQIIWDSLNPFYPINLVS